MNKLMCKKIRVYRIGKINNVINHTILTFCITMLYKVLLDYCYISYIVPEFGYMGFKLNINILQYILGFIGIIICFFIIGRANKISQIYLFLHYVIMIIPLSTIAGLENRSIIFFFFCISCFIMECLLLRYLPNIKFKLRGNVYYFKIIIIVTLTFVVYFYLLTKKGLPTLTALNLNSVYEIRIEAQFSGMFAYLISWQAKVINPILIAEGFKNKRMSFIIGILLQLLLFLYTGNKSYIFTIFGIIGIMYIYEFCKRRRLSFSDKFIKIFTTMVLITILISVTLVGTYLLSFLIRRFLIVPANLKYDYYEFFSNHNFLYYSQSLIGKIFNIENSYIRSIPNIIGEYFYNDPKLYANTGYLGESYANLGYLGMLLNSVLLVFVLKLFDSFAKSMDSGIIIGATVFLIIGLNDTSLITSFMTGGLLLLLLLFYIMVISNKERKFYDK